MAFYLNMNCQELLYLATRTASYAVPHELIINYYHDMENDILLYGLSATKKKDDAQLNANTLTHEQAEEVEFHQAVEKFLYNYWHYTNNLDLSRMSSEELLSFGEVGRAITELADNEKLRRGFVKPGQIMHLFLKKQWYDMIVEGKKTEEYREFNDYYKSGRLIDMDYPDGFADGTYAPAKPYVAFHRGYTRIQTLFKVDGYLHVGYGKPEWGAPTDRKVFILKIGERVK